LLPIGAAACGSAPLLQLGPRPLVLLAEPLILLPGGELVAHLLLLLCIQNALALGGCTFGVLPLLHGLVGFPLLPASKVGRGALPIMFALFPHPLLLALPLILDLLLAGASRCLLLLLDPLLVEGALLLLAAAIVVLPGLRWRA
jgi:hypothetical protein